METTAIHKDPDAIRAGEQNGESRFKAYGVTLSIRALLVLIIVLASAYMSMLGIKIEEPFYSLVTVSVGYYFGQKK
jgi:hypothetical protein